MAGDPKGSATNREGVTPTVGEILVRAVLERRPVRFDYHGLRRTVEPHLVGIHEAGEAMLVGYQTAGASQSGEVPGWRTFILAEIGDPALEEGRFAGPRPDFNPAAERMTEIFARAS